MFKKGLLLSILLLFIGGCAGTIRIAEEDKKDSTIPNKNMIVKPKK